MDLTLGALQMGKKNGDEFTDEETARRRDEVIKRMANTPPKPHSEMRLGKRKPASHLKPAKAKPSSNS